MAKRTNSDQSPAKAPIQRRDPRTAALNNVWGSALAMLALCIPLCAVLRSAMIPILVVAGTAIVSLYIWWSGAAEREADTSEADALRDKIKELEDRLANVEVINRFEDRLAEKRLRQEAEQTAPPPRIEEQT